MGAVDLIERIDVREPYRSGLQYDVFFGGDRPNGFVHLDFLNVENCIKNGYKIFGGFGHNDIVAHLSQFRPNGRGLSSEDIRKYSREGVGSLMLERAIDDSMDKGAKIMTTLVTTKQMRGFVEKNCFRLIGDDKYFLVL